MPVLHKVVGMVSVSLRHLPARLGLQNVTKDLIVVFVLMYCCHLCMVTQVWSLAMTLLAR